LSSTREREGDPGDGQPRRRWTTERLTRAILELHRRGVPITKRGLIEAGEQKLAQVINYFGGFRLVRRAAGLAPPRPTRRTSTPP
jgi:hypothetical protein